MLSLKQTILLWSLIVIILIIKIIGRHNGTAQVQFSDKYGVISLKYGVITHTSANVLKKY